MRGYAARPAKGAEAASGRAGRDGGRPAVADGQVGQLGPEAAINAGPRVRRLQALRATLNGAGPPSAVVQRNIGADNPPAGGPFYRVVNAHNQAVRPPWVGHWADGGAANAALGAGQSRNHVISHHHIAESLTNLLNAIYTQRADHPLVVPAAVAQLTQVTNSLFPLSPVALAAMAVQRTATVAAIYASVAGTVAGAAVPANAGAIATAATALESLLTSSQDNVRGGDAGMNLRLGNNIDAQYAGHVTLPAYAVPTPAFLTAGLAVPTAWTAPPPGGVAGANWGALEGGAVLGVGTQFYCMTATHNQIVWNFMSHAPPHVHANLTVVRNDDSANPVPGGYTAHAPLSSSGDPGAGLPGGVGAGAAVLIFDPVGAAPPRRFA